MTMHVTIHQADLNRAVGWAAKSLPSRPSVPVLAGLKLTAEDGQLQVGAFDYDTCAQVTAGGATVTKPGTILVPGRMFAAIVAALPARPVVLEQAGDQLTVTYGAAAGSKFTVMLLPADEYPAFPALPAVTGTCAPAALASAIASVLPAVSKDPSLPVLTAVNFEVRADGLTLAATDRYELAVADVEWKLDQEMDPEMETRNVLVPGTALAQFAQGLPDSGTATISLPDDDGDANGVPMIGFSSGAGGRTVTVRAISGEFVKWRQLLDKNAGGPTTVEVDAAELTEAVKRVRVAAKDRSPITFTIWDGQIVLEASANDGTIAGSDTIAAETEGDKLVIKFAPALFLDATGPVTGMVRIRLGDPAKPALVTRATDDAFRALLMPVRTQDGPR